ncbi:MULTISPECIES: hypothetical protein [unclassified Streptomyces]|uniref:hypothetical protein n=1 Tax=unclassified Streptomyces TaxID=2593676 RepID=UPI0021DA8991|nr:hypothetical protein [Streptomyces sp. A13(2022)]MCU8589359.1 hypothetical protein [Streptomyces sp. A13(2022)]
MNGKPIPIRKTPPPPDVQLRAAETTADYLGLPAVRRPIVREDGVHFVVADGEDFAEWVHALGGEVNRAPQLDGASLWTLRTETPRRDDGSTVRLRVHVALISDEWVPEQFRGPVAS